MAINIRTLKDGSIKYEARLSCRNTKNRCRRFLTREAAERQLEKWEAMKAKQPKLTKEQRIKLQVKFLEIQNSFLLGGVR